MLNDAFPHLLSTRSNASPFEHVARVLNSARRGGAHLPLRAWADDTGLVLEILVPGVTSESLELEVEGNVLILRAEREPWAASQEEPKRRLERRLSLPYAVDERAVARLENGVLSLDLPRADRPRRIALQGAEAPAVVQANERTRSAEESAERRNASLRARQAGAAYHVALDAPGVHKDNLTLTLDGDDLHLVAEPSWSAPQGMRLTHADYAPCTWTASLHVPDDVDRDAIAAKVEAGVVQLTLPRRVIPSRRIEVLGS